MAIFWPNIYISKFVKIVFEKTFEMNNIYWRERYERRLTVTNSNHYFDPDQPLMCFYCLYTSSMQ